MSLPGNQTVREQILVKLRDRLLGLNAWVGGVAAVTEKVELDAAFAAGKAFVIYGADSDINLENEGIDRKWNVEAFHFDVRLCVLVPEAMMLTPQDPDSAQRTGARIHGQLVQAMLTPGALGLAYRVDTLGGGGIGFVDEGDRVLAIESGFAVHYRTLRGQPEVVV